MKFIQIMNQNLKHIALITILIAVSACNNNSKPDDTKAVAEEQNDKKFGDNQPEIDAQFLVNAAESNLKIINLSQLAQVSGKSSQIKEMGRMMEKDHTKSLNNIASLAKSKMISIPTSPTEDAKKEYKDLNAKPGDNFDKAYSDMMVNEHIDAISVYEKATTECNDTEIKNWAIAALPDLRTHLDQALSSQKKNDK